MPAGDDAAELAEAMHHFAAHRWAKAERIAAAIATRAPSNAAALHVCGAAAAQLGDRQRAITLLRRAVAANPAARDPRLDLARLLVLTGHAMEAAEHYESAALTGAVDAAEWCVLSNALLQARSFAPAEAAARRAVAANHLSPAAYINLGASLHQQGRLAEAVEQYRAAISHDRSAALAYSNLGDALSRLDDFDAARTACQLAVELKPDQSSFWNNLSAVLFRQGQFDEALSAARRAIALDPANAAAHANAGHVLLTLGRFDEGWAEYEWRTAAINSSARSVPLWDGSPLDGRRILLTHEQGFGDTIQFIRYAPLVAARGGQVIVACPPPLKDLLQTAAGVDEVVAWGEPPPEVAVQLPVMSLPHRFRTTLETIPADVPYLRVDAARVDRLRRHVPNDDGTFRVGLVWAGNPGHINDRRRSIPLAALVPLRDVPRVALYSLQKGPAAERDATDIARLNLIDLGSACQDFADLAAAISLLDLVITVDTAPAHLAGALGRPVWVMLPYVPEWRWMQQRTDSPWYPTMRLFRQPREGDWDAVVAEVTVALRREAGDRVNSPPR